MMATAMFALLLRRLVFSVRRQRELAQDVKQAQEVQRVLLPENITVPGFTIQTEYRPAREVGGDFFQIIPNTNDGSVLIVAGDVTGKGLQAGMLVAVLVGGIRSTYEYTSEPRAILEALNRRLLGREGAFATCLALRIQTNGKVTLANAGHLAPYLNDREVPMDGALPLGMIPGADFPVSTFQLQQGDTLTLISDGILEAQDKTGQLFGFDRIRDLLHTTLSATALASAAQAFGQNDDISVVSVTRTASA
jgi:serine phosphatase RsbU (regulator of sigma subunit)